MDTVGFDTAWVCPAVVVSILNTIRKHSSNDVIRLFMTKLLLNGYLQRIMYNDLAALLSCRGQGAFPPIFLDPVRSGLYGV